MQRPAVEDVFALLGLVLVGVGVGMVYIPASLIVVGVLLLAAAYRIGRAR